MYYYLLIGLSTATFVECYQIVLRFNYHYSSPSLTAGVITSRAVVYLKGYKGCSVLSIAYFRILIVQLKFHLAFFPTTFFFIINLDIASIISSSIGSSVSSIFADPVLHRPHLFHLLATTKQVVSIYSQV